MKVIRGLVLIIIMLSCIWLIMDDLFDERYISRFVQWVV